MTYPETAGFQSHSITSKEAADQLDATQMRQIAFDLVSHNAWRGRTADEVNAELEEKYGKERVHIAPRFRELEMDGKLIKTQLTRKTRYNRNASVYVTPAYFTEDMGRASVKAEKPTDFIKLEAEHARMKNALEFIAGTKSIETIKADIKAMEGSFCPTLEQTLGALYKAVQNRAKEGLGYEAA